MHPEVRIYLKTMKDANEHIAKFYHEARRLVFMLKSKTKLWAFSNYQAFMLLDHTLFREERESDHYHLRESHSTAKLLNLY